MKKFNRGQLVTYKVDKHNTVEAVVRNLHRDGTITVEARFFQFADGRPRGAYLGYHYRMENSDLTPT